MFLSCNYENGPGSKFIKKPNSRKQLCQCEQNVLFSVYVIKLLNNVYTKRIYYTFIRWLPILMSKNNRFLTLDKVTYISLNYLH